MSKDYNPHAIEKQLQSQWLITKPYTAKMQEDKEKYYCLSMFPYPSGKLHMGHVRNYTITDVIARFQTIRGKNVLHPIGWDAFGMPAENAAIANKTSPATWTRNNIQIMKKQLQRLGFSFDWSREIATCDTSYYRWEQWFFVRLLDRGIIYKKDAMVNWCPTDQTVLANEQVVEGCCWRCSTEIEKKEIPQWFLSITQYAEELLSGLDSLDGWPKNVVAMQRNWIGKSHGMNIAFSVKGDYQNIEIYTTRPDTLMGVSYIALSAEHPLVKKLVSENSTLANFVSSIKGTTEQQAQTGEKLGIDTGLCATHPISGEEVPIWIASYVLMEYGTGAVMAVPAHDERDAEFAKKYQLPAVEVIRALKDVTRLFCGKGKLIHSGQFDGMDFTQAFDAINTLLQQKGLGFSSTHYRLRDWGISRQRYWGTPIPMVEVESGEIIPAEDIPVELPEHLIPIGEGSPLAEEEEWLKTESQGMAARRESDTLDTFFESSWYYARYTCPHFHEGMLETKEANYWLPVDQYVGGVEHAVLHLLYARFFHKLMRDEGLISSDEPFKNLLCQGMVLARSYYYDDTAGRIWVNPEQVHLVHSEPCHKQTGQALIDNGMTKMSKSKNNGVDPQQMIDTYGADAVRTFMMFAAPPEQSLEWSEKSLVGSVRFLNRLWRLVQQYLAVDIDDTRTTREDICIQIKRKTHQAIAKVTQDFEQKHSFNTAIASVMELANTASKFQAHTTQEKQALEEMLSVSIILLYPIAPHITTELWSIMGLGDIAQASWPQVNEKALESGQACYAIQVNGKVRAQLELAAGLEQQEVIDQALKQPNVELHVENKEILRTIFVPNKLVNFVAK